MKFLVDNLASRLVRTGNLTISYPDGSSGSYGDGSGTPVHMRLKTQRAVRGLAIDPAYYLGHYYGSGDIELAEGDMYALLRTIFTGNPDFRYYDTAWNKVLERLRYVLRWFREKNSIGRSRRNVQHHYDLTGALYDLFLDEDRQYSCGYFERPDQTLDEAQLAKKRHIASKLCINRPGQTVLDIGCGWGGMALYLARHLGAKVTGVTLSDEQHALARQRATDGGLDDTVHFLLQDYRNTEGPFDRVVSVGMFEHVGRPNYLTFFRKSASLLKKDGVMLLHTIGRTDQPTANNPFIEKYIFPGGYIPALSEVMQAIEKSGLAITDIEILRLHYAETLRHWRERFMARREEAKALYDERFCRIWEFYLAASESAFRWQNLVVFQIQLVHDQEAVPLLRDYIGRGEDCLRQHEASSKGRPQGARQFPQEASL
ncbi:cyclopropane-fatty-acyl-phospholipid synthase family protein [Shinella daejeonensis]|uniref:SAM-dependent methyltransferase n=1 Tax=Shinella daejeonensis TaxID=659017 RepID=UPI0020C7E335|nr:cyclopropane-fatty-acyl-phospholipid synthase family protein [Shinella daejeonensis]MCP8895708.1 cyclopropane-fatty-acyl-phospholipid synthase family protein [Shinella daejeonensis]